MGSTLHYSLKPRVLTESVPQALEVLLQARISLRDLARTADALMVRAGIPNLYQRTLLGHTLKTIDRHYVQSDLERDLRPAMAQYTGWLKKELDAQEKGQVIAC